MQGHKTFLYVVDNDSRRYQWKCFMKVCNPTTFELNGPESIQAMVMQIQGMYEAYSHKWIEGLDEPSVVCALSMKYITTYQRCRGGPTNDNTWLMEVGVVIGWVYISRVGK